MEGKARWCGVEMLRKSVEHVSNSNRRTVISKCVEAVARSPVGFTYNLQAVFSAELGQDL